MLDQLDGPRERADDLDGGVEACIVDHDHVIHEARNALERSRDQPRFIVRRHHDGDSLTGKHRLLLEGHGVEHGATGYRLLARRSSACGAPWHRVTPLRMAEVLFVSKPVAPPWNDSSKNLVRDIAGHLRRHSPVLMGRAGQTNPIDRGRVEAVYRAACPPVALRPVREKTWGFCVTSCWGVRSISGTSFSHPTRGARPPAASPRRFEEYRASTPSAVCRPKGST